MVRKSCIDDDDYTANYQFITPLMGCLIGSQGSICTPTVMKEFESELKLIEKNTKDSFDLFYGLYKYKSNSLNTKLKLRESMKNMITYWNAMEKKQDEWVKS